MDTAPFTLEITQDAPAVFHAPPCCGSLDLRLGDCMDVMKTFPDGHFDLAIVDPPYGISAEKMNMCDGYYGKGRKDRLSQGSGKLKNRILQNGQSEWDAKPPGPEYFAELRRVSKHQIIWGANYFPLPPTRCVVSWDKEQPWPNFSAWEMAWTSFDKPAKLFRWNNQGTGNPGKIHPTQKPVQLYKWLFQTFAEPGQRVLDTHLGSGSIAIAAHYAGIHLTACEISADYYEAAKARIAKETAQTELFIHHNAGGDARRADARNQQ
jgi:site-specific DNA-methyltransferase (adenine-specific)